MARWLPSIHGLPRAYWTLWFGTLVNRLGGFVVPFLAFYLKEKRHVPIEQAGLVVSLFGLGSLAAGPLGGWLADRLGRRSTMVGALVCGAAAMLVLAFARTVPELAVATLALGLFGDLYRPAVSAMIADLVPEDRARAFSLLHWAVNLGFSIAPVVAGLLASASFLSLFVGDAATSLAFAAILWLRVPETRPARVPRPAAAPLEGSPWTDGVFLAFCLVGTMVAMVFVQSMVTLPMDMSEHGIGARRFGMLIAINGALIVLLQPFAARVLSPYRRAHVLAVGALLIGVGFGAMALAHGAPSYALAIAVFTLGEIITTPTSATIVADLAPVDRRGAYQGVYQMSWSAAFLVGPWLGARILGRWSGPALWTACLALGVAAAVAHLLLAGPRRRRIAALRAQV